MKRFSVSFTLFSLCLFLLFLNFKGFAWVTDLFYALLIAIYLGYFILKKNWKSPLIILLVFYPFMNFIIYSYSSYKWQNQFDVIEKIKAVEIKYSGQCKLYWSSGGYSRIKFFVLDTDMDSTETLRVINEHIDVSEILPMEKFIFVHPATISGGEMYFVKLDQAPYFITNALSGKLFGESTNSFKRFVLWFEFGVETSN